MKIQLPPCFDEEIVPYEPPERQHKNLKDLLEYDPFTFLVDCEDCECTVTIVRIPEDKKWWYPACTSCPKKPAMNPKSLECSGSTNYCFRPESLTNFYYIFLFHYH
jgi:hypothetical protein